VKTFKQYLEESPASEAAVRLGLKYYGFGRYGVRNKVTHHSEFGWLRKVKDAYHASKGETPLVHLEHLEDEILNNGVVGVRNALNYLHGIEALMKGHDDRVKLVVKLDGSPSLTFGTIYDFPAKSSDKSEPRHWVSTKSAFNNSPKLNYTEEDIELNHGHAPGLVEKLKAALKHIHKIQPKTTLQGDLLFTKEDIKKENIQGTDYYTFKPNTIKYAVPVDSEMGRKIAAAKIGIAIHTKYHDFNKPERHPAQESDYKQHKDVFTLPIQSPQADIDVSYRIKALGSQFNQTSKEALDFAKANSQTLKQYINATVKSSTEPKAEDFIEWYQEKARKEINKLKSQSGKEKKQARLSMEVSHLQSNHDNISQIFGLHAGIQHLKNEIIDTLDKNQQIKHFYDTPEGMQETTPEGYVVIGASGSLKLVRRHSFSRANFLGRPR
jgi:hypothetical protein